MSQVVLDTRDFVFENLPGFWSSLGMNATNYGIDNLGNDNISSAIGGCCAWAKNIFEKGTFDYWATKAYNKLVTKKQHQLRALLIF